MKKMLLTGLLGLACFWVSAQCPVQLLQCPGAVNAVCDATDNSPLLWNDSKFLNAAISSHDLADAPFDISFTFRDSCGGGIVGITLLLDLDGNGVQETAVTPDHFLSGGSLLINNAFNPGYSGTDTAKFDIRPVMPNQKYRFALETTTSGDTTTVRLRWSPGPGNYVIPQLPYGNHKVIWTLQRPDSTYTCAGNFMVQDCKKPTVVCIMGLSVYIDNLLQPPHSVPLWVMDFLQYTEDNYTPPDQIELSITKGGAETGFPLDSSGNPKSTISFDCNELGPQLVELWARDQAGNVDSCTTYVIVQDNAGNCSGIPGGPYACIGTEQQDLLEEVGFEYNTPNPLPPFYFNPATPISNGCWDLHLTGIPLSSDFTITPVKDDNPLNGVTTFDIVLISKHILGLELLNSPYKIIAADANKSNSITSFDLVEFRKLVLGIYNELPYNTSWRFVLKNFAFTNPANPFLDNFPISATLAQYNAGEANFVAIKVGDVNGSAIANSFAGENPEDRAAGQFILDDRRLAAGETAELPVYAAGEEGLLGFQFSLGTAQDLLEIEAVVPGNLPELGAGNFSGSASGGLNMSWNTEQMVRPDPTTPLFTLRVRAKAPVRLSEALTLEGGRLRPELYAAGETPRPLELLFRTTDPERSNFEVFAPVPNPTGAGFRLAFHAKNESGRLLFTLTDAFGKTVYAQGLEAESVPQHLDVPAEAMPVSGLYFWRLSDGEHSAGGKIVKQ